MNPVTKGKSGEREAAGLVRDLTGWEVRRRVRQHGGDSDLVGAPGWAIEVKRRRAATHGDLANWWDQAVEQSQASGERPVLLYRLDRGAWRAVWPIGALLAQPGVDAHGYAWTANTTVAAWSAMARRLAEQPAAASSTCLEGIT